MTPIIQKPPVLPRTAALRRVLAERRDAASTADLLFLEDWEVQPRPEPGVAFRIHQIRRANPELAAAIRAELSTRRV
jgi:hypothetical protein